MTPDLPPYAQAAADRLRHLPPPPLSPAQQRLIQRVLTAPQAAQAA